MQPTDDLYRCAENALVRAARHAGLVLPAWPDLTTDHDPTPAQAQQWCAWLREVWAADAVAGAVEHASPVLARQVEAVCARQCTDVRKVHRVALSMARYLLRMTGRATPFGLFAGVAPTSFGRHFSLRWGHAHRAIARADASWLADVISRLESCPQLIDRLPLVANSTCFLRGNRLVVPYQPRPHSESRTAAGEVSVRHTAAVRVAVEVARCPIRGDELAGKLATEFPTAPPAAIGTLLAELVNRRVLISTLRAPSTVTDAFGHLLEQLDEVGADDVPQVSDLVSRLRDIGAALEQHNHADPAESCRGLRKTVGARMATIAAAARHPVAVDLRLDCTLVLPRQVTREAEIAASVLARLTAHPFGTTAWQRYHRRFFERYGIGSLVPVMDVTAPDVGLGFPDGYAGTIAQEPPAPLTARDRRLLELAQAAALEGRDEIVLDERSIAELAAPELERARVPPHLELCFQLHAASPDAVERGEYALTIVGVPRAAGTMTGRFAGLFEPSEQERMIRDFAQLPASDPDTLPVQLSFPPLDPGTAHVARAPRLLPAVVSLGEHRGLGEDLIRLEDLAVACDGHRLYLASLTLGRRLEPTVLHALDLRAHTPPLARFLAEVGRAQNAVVTGFDWGVASGLPHLPRVRHRRTILCPARWRVDRTELPERDAPWRQWEESVAALRTRRRIPGFVYLGDGDRRLRLDLDEAGHLALLRAHLARNRHAVLVESPGSEAYGWFGGRAHEIVVPLLAAQPPRWLTVPRVSAARMIGRDHGHPPGASTWLYAKLYGHPERQAEILAEHLPRLLSAWDEPPTWWFIRYRDPECHLRLRIALSRAEEFGSAAGRVSTWAGDLRRLGLLRDVQFATYYPETGRWGGGSAMAAAEEVFAADSRALVAQFAVQPADSAPPHPQALAAANFVAIAAGFSGSPEAGMRWLIEHAQAKATSAPLRHVLTEAVRLADPRDGWTALRAVPGGQAIVTAWEPRHRALTDYRARLTGAEGIDPDAVLVSLLHTHHIRAVGIDRDDERVCLRLARAAALAWDARTTYDRSAG